MPIQNPKSRIQNQKGRVIVVGSTNTDLVVRCDRLPRPGETILGGDLQTFAGGKGANQAVAAARAGAKVHFIGAFGDDAFGRARRADLEREGIDCSGCVIKKGVPSGVALIAVGATGKGKGSAKAENQILVAPGANARLTPADVRRGMPNDLIHGDILLCSLEIPLRTVFAAMREVVKEIGMISIILNPAPLPPEGIPHQLNLAVTITPNQREFEKLIGSQVTSVQSQEALIRRLTNHSMPCKVIVTCGSDGAIYQYMYEEFSESREAIEARMRQGLPCKGEQKLGVDKFPAPKVVAVDTVGAGDCFNGCLAAFLSERPLNYSQAIPFAVAAAAIQVTRPGAQAAMPYRHEILKMLKRMKSS